VTTADRILDVAEGLVQTRGYAAFSYADIAQVLRIRKASVHYHFASKGELTRAVAARYRAGFSAALQELEVRYPDPTRRLTRYVRLFQDALRAGDHMCLYGMLASDSETLPEPVRAELHRFLADQEVWLAKLLTEGRTAGAFRFEGTPAAQASGLLAGLEGAMLLARARRDVPRFASMALTLVSALTS
jgi:TetR/AcrR family transcriptional repressor of nem operon